MYKKKEIINGREIKVKIWDTAGQEQFKSLTRNFFHKSDGIIMMYDITSKKSFDQIKTWMQCIKDNAPENVKVILVGNKCDLFHNRVISEIEGQALADELKLNFFETSSLSNINITTSIISLISQIIKEKTQLEEAIILLNNKNDHEDSKKGCGC